MNNLVNMTVNNSLWLSIRFQLQPASRDGDYSTIIGYLFGKKEFFQVSALYFFEEVGVLFEVHRGLGKHIFIH
jgi:hypothetical protein